jgi:hypothetical protein
VRTPGEVRAAAATPGGEPGPARGVPGAAPASGAGHVRPPEVDLDTEKPVADRNGRSPWRVAQDAASVRARGTIGRVPAAGPGRLYVDAGREALSVTSSEDSLVSEYRDTFETLVNLALPQDKSIEFIRAAAEEMF